jgi:hypothetical protein
MCHDFASLTLELNSSFWLPDNIVLSGQELMFTLSVWIGINDHLFNPETDSTKLDDVSELTVETVGLTGIKEILGVSNNLPGHLDMILIRVFLDTLVVEKPVVVVLID